MHLKVPLLASKFNYANIVLVTLYQDNGEKDIQVIYEHLEWKYA